MPTDPTPWLNEAEVEALRQRLAATYAAFAELLRPIADMLWRIDDADAD